MKNMADDQIVSSYNNGDDSYRGYMYPGHYTWGSSQLKAEWANLLTFAIKLNVNAANTAKYREVAEEYLHYFHGRNALSEVYLSNMGTKGANLGGDKSVMQVYHSWFGDGSPKYDGANSTFGPIPGYLVGGPNEFFSVSTITPPAGQPPMKSFKDWNTGWPENSWEITEPAIYYQAAYTLLLSQYATQPPAVLPAWLAPGSAATWNAANKTLDVTGVATIVADPGADQPAVTVTGSSAVLTVNPTSALAVHLASLSLTNGARATVTSLGAARTAANHRVLVIDDGGLTIDTTSKLDLTDNDLLVDYPAGGGSTAPADVAAMVKRGFNGGSWLGASGITSSAAAANPRTALAAVDNALRHATAFAGVGGLTGTQVLVKYTYTGDADLGGTVTLDDFTLFLGGYQTPAAGKTWFAGDFDYSGQATLDDFTLFLYGYRNQSSAL